MFNNRTVQRRRETDEHQGPLLVPNPHAFPGSADLWPASGGSKRSPDGARPTNIRGRCSSQTRTLPLGARASGPHLVGASVLPGLKSFPVPASWLLAPLSMNWAKIRRASSTHF